MRGLQHVLGDDELAEVRVRVRVAELGRSLVGGHDRAQ